MLSKVFSKGLDEVSYVDDRDERGSSANWNDQSEFATPFHNNLRQLNATVECPEEGKYANSEMKPSTSAARRLEEGANNRSQISRSPNARFSHISEEPASQGMGSKILSKKPNRTLF